MLFANSHAMMCQLWTGCIVLGIAYVIVATPQSEAIPFAIGQAVLGLIGLSREYVIIRSRHQPPENI